MAQSAHPVEPDITVGSWGTAPLYEKLDESPANDSDFVSVTDPSSATFEVKLSPIDGPPWENGDKRVTVRARRTTSSLVKLNIELLQGATPIAPPKFAMPSQSFADISIPLSNSVLSKITDYSDLRVRVTASCYDGPACPDGTFYQTVHFSNKTGDCTCLPDTLQLDQPTNSCEGNLSISLDCIEGQYVVTCNGNPCEVVSYSLGEIVAQLPDPVPCGSSGSGTALARITA